RGCARCCAAAVSARGPNSVARDSATRFLKPRVLIRCVVDNQFGNDAQIALMRGVQKRSEILERAENRIDVEVIGNVVAVVSQWGWIERQQPDRGDAEFLQIIQLFHETAKVAHAVAIAVAKGFDVQLVDDGVLVPKRIDRCIDIPLCHGSTLDTPNVTRNHAILYCWKALDGRAGPAYRLSISPRRSISVYLLLRLQMARSKMVSSVRGKPKRRVRLPRARTQPISVAPKLEPGAPSDFELMKGIQTGDADALSELY